MICFVVLHYKNMDITLKCIECLKKLNGSKKIIVVDNNTCNEIDKEILAKENVDLLFLDENKGFAKANNEAINYAKKKYNPDFVAVINNDVLINQNNFIKIVNDTYKKYQFDMLGPKIDSPSGESINPFPVIDTIEKVNNEIDYVNKLITIYKSRLLYILLKSYLFIKKKIKKSALRCNGKTLQEKIALHGCCIIFSKKYLLKYKDTFYNETFLFHEEEFLYKRVIDDNLISIYNPDLEVFHEEGSSTKKINHNERLIKLFREQERLKSLILLRKNWSKKI